MVSPAPPDSRAGCYLFLLLVIVALVVVAVVLA